MKIQSRIRGKRARANGGYFEQIIDRECRKYEDYGLAKIEKTPEPMKPLRRPNLQGQFLACYTKHAQPDYKGTLKGGQAVVFEAKHTDADRIEKSRVTDEQLSALYAHRDLGAKCFILISFKFERFYRVPIDIWANMERFFKKKSVNENDLAPYRLVYGCHFLGATVSRKDTLWERGSVVV